MIVKMIQNLGNRMEKIQEMFNKDLEELKSKQTMMNNTINEIKSSLEGINSRITEAEEQISDLEDKIVEITTAEQTKEKRMKRIENSLREFWDNIKRTNIRIIGVLEEEETKKGTEKIFEEIIVENFPNMGNEIVNQLQEAQRVPYRINPRRYTPKHVLFCFVLIYLFFAAFDLCCCARAFSSSGKWGYSLLRCVGFSFWWLLLLQGTGSRRAGFSGCGTWAQ